ncbi:FMN-binding protein [Pseudanabaena sp. PCC 6802]|uniref:FMN-binding protein n=1 Tax=Pseudanabaena sp. PCC 6802 TaxID=118173 RepID=UPI00034C00A4|nr:FMN-binding protein [Pseudanabaena sp. PCC 6802]
MGGFTYVVEVTVTQQKITRINILRNRPDVYPKLAAGITKKVINAQKIDIDAVTGATTTSKALLLAIENALRQGTKS